MTALLDWLIFLLFLALAFGLAEWARRDHDRALKRELQAREAAIAAQINAFRVANRLHVEFWRTKQQMDVEAKAQPAP